MIIAEATPYSLQEGFSRHKHADEYELYLFYLGNGTFQTGTRNIPFRSPVLFLVPPHTGHQLRVEPDCRLVRIYGIRFSWKRGHRRLKTAARRLIGPGRTVDSTTALSAFDGIRRRITTDDTFLHRSAAAWLTSYLYDVCAAGDTVPATMDNRYVAEAVRILRNSVYTHIDSDTLAGEVGISKAYLIRLFRKHMGTTPMRYLSGFRTEGAAWQLEHTNKPVHQIAREFMFYDEFHFSRVFKERQGMPPRVYRETVRKT